MNFYIHWIFTMTKDDLIKNIEQDYEIRALVLQGGGALGAYQAGVYEGLAEKEIDITFFAGISIGALNVAILAGNPVETRVEKLRQFWDTICQPYFGTAPNPILEQSLYQINDWTKQFIGAYNAASAVWLGQKGFFRPKMPNLMGNDNNDPKSVGHYDTSPLKQTLESLCDFDLINDSKRHHVTVGAVNVRTGNITYFDNRKITLKPEHFMASGALPPAFPAIEIDGEYYWDGGLVSNTPLTKVLEQQRSHDTLVFQVDLWSARGPVPKSLDEISDRIQDIRYSSRTRLVTDEMRADRRVQRLLRKILDQVPEEIRKSEAFCKQAEGIACNKVSNIIHLIYRDKSYEQHFRDYQFGLATMREHWASGLHDIRNTFDHKAYFTKPDNAAGFITHDVHRDEIEYKMQA